MQEVWRGNPVDIPRQIRMVRKHRFLEVQAKNGKSLQVQSERDLRIGWSGEGKVRGHPLHSLKKTESGSSEIRSYRIYWTFFKSILIN